MMRRIVVIAGLSILGVALIAAGVAGPLMSQVETPIYAVERSDGAIEVRSYPQMTVASVTSPGDRGTAVNRGFRTLANYIFGENAGAAKIAMTAPVLQSRFDAAPSDAWTIRFIMPRTLATDTLPAPRDGRVTLTTVSAARYAVIRFSGFWRDQLLVRKTDELRAWIGSQGLVAHGAPIYAFYNPPWTLPMFRRNEVMIELGPSRGQAQ